MSLNCMPKEELELLTYPDMAYMLIKENNKPMNTPSIFKKICELLSYSDAEYAAKIGDFYTSLTTDKRFFLLDTAEWDLRTNHSVKIVVEDDEEYIEEDIDDEEIEEDIESEDLDIDLENEEVDEDDSLDDLSLVDEEEIEE